MQAQQTGERLKNLNLKYTKLVCSNLIRAVETADIISSYLPGVPRQTCQMLREGSPVEPDPASSRWRPEKKVSSYRAEFLQQYCKTLSCVICYVKSRGGYWLI